MAMILRKMWDAYQFLFEEISDPRSKEWFLAAKPYQIVTLLGLYHMFVLKWGPQFMKNRKPFNLDIIMVAYNAIQVVVCVLIFIKALYLGWGWDYKWFCEPIDYSFTPKAIEVSRLTYYYFLLKVVDLLDTIFFVLRKKFNQVSFLHVYHHTGMVLLTWGSTTYLPGGHGSMVGVINSFVHVFMYSYYLLTVIVPSIKKAIWIKKFVTQLQIIQFFLLVAHMSVIVFKTDCEYPRWTSALFLPQNLFMLVLFVDFYIKTYVKNPKPQQDKVDAGNKTETNNNNNETIQGFNQDNASDYLESNNGNIDYNMESTTFASVKSKTNGHKQFKNE
ncbi:elongation of very long chain fatty acids protein 7-like [Trichoplusia ni]|uniref:Elongation of very long chain fatty acids protein n=1 Tax=Trichoplusia ni TaxID=7111 RepID=A0A7E5VNL6_TRINI|nr:elongation of very long chain fatty acids protein 7-like [Trichoplusia ni]